MATRTIGTPRFYCDIPSYLRSIGKYYGVRTTGLATPEEPNQEKVYNMNPYKPNEFDGADSHSWASFRFFINQDVVDTNSQIFIEDDELWKLLSYTNNSDGHHSTGWFSGVLGHNFGSLQSTMSSVLSMTQKFKGVADGGASAENSTPSSFEEIVNARSGGTGSGWAVAEYDGYSLWEITSRIDIDVWRYNILTHSFENTVDWGSNNLKIGACTCGIFFEPPNSPDLQVKLSLEYEGINSDETIGGSTLVNIDYTGVPNWGDLPAWTLQKTDGSDYTTVANRARRTWELSFSYISDDNLFDKANNSNKFVNDTFSSDVEDNHTNAKFDTSMSSFFKLTHFGALPFIFCPNSQLLDDSGNVDKEKLEFAICELDQDSLVATQVAFQTWNISMRVVEVW